MLEERIPDPLKVNTPCVMQWYFTANTDWWGVIHSRENIVVHWSAFQNWEETYKLSWLRFRWINIAVQV